MAVHGVKTGAHTQFKENLKVELNNRVGQTVRVRAGPSWDERMEVAVKAFQTKARAEEGEAKKMLGEAIEKGRSRATSCPIRSSADAPNQAAMLQKRKKDMHDREVEYKERLEALRDKMEKREPLFRLSDVQNAFQMQKERMMERKRQMQKDEHERWEHLRSVEQAASSRPLLIEDANYKPPKKNHTSSAPSLGGDAAKGIDKAHSPKVAFGGREEYEKDIKIREAVGTKWFQNSEWAQTVREIKERANNRKKLHEEAYPNKGDRHELTRNRLMHRGPACVPAVY